MRILVVEDSRRLRGALAKGLRAEGYAVDAVDNGPDGLIHARTTDYDVIVLDLMLPGMDGLDVLRRLRELGRKTHILILSARDTVDDRVTGLRCGADDYLVKPFAFAELIARIEALARREHDQKHPTIEVGTISIDTVSRVAKAGADVLSLTPREYRILEYLAMNRGRPVRRDELEEHVYDERSQVWSNAVDSAISALRRKLREVGSDRLIRTRRGVGYQIDLEPAKDAS